MRRLLLTLLFATTVRAQVNTTEVWVGRLDFREFAVSGLTNISNHPGYDNQPTFFPDGNTLVYTSQVRDLSETGQGVEAVIFDLKTGAVTPTRVRGFSPTPFEGGLLVLREGDVWKHDLRGGEGIEMTAVDRAGYFTRFDERTWVLFMNDEQRRIVIYDAKTKALETIATGAITAPYRVPGKRAVTFVTSDKVLHRLDVPVGWRMADGGGRESSSSRRPRAANRQPVLTSLGAIPFKTGGHHVWTPRGSILMASGNAIHEWKEGWKEVWRTDHPDLQSISRIALSPNADRIALVSVPRDETVIRDSRAAGAAAYAKDAKIIGAEGQQVDVRATERLDLGRDSAAEYGTWTGGGKKGRYMAVWRGTTTESGTRSWTIVHELLATLE